MLFLTSCNCKMIFFLVMAAIFVCGFVVVSFIFLNFAPAFDLIGQ